MNKYEYQAALRLFRKGELWNVPTQLSAHVWDVKQHVEEMGLPPSLQYHPLTEAFRAGRSEFLTRWLSHTDPSPDPFEEALLECGMTQDGDCMQAGTEYCDWKCPIARMNFDGDVDVGDDYDEEKEIERLLGDEEERE